MDFKLIVKKLKNVLNEAEHQEFDSWYKASHLHREYFKKVEANFDTTLENIDTDRAWKILEARMDKPTNTFNYRKYGIAATFALLMALSFYVLNSKVNKSNSTSFGSHNIVSGTNKAILTLGDGENIDLIKGKTFTTEFLESNGEELIYNINATPIQPEIKYNDLTVPLGGQYVLKLSDETKIWLNSGSKIKYPVTFKEGDTRVVELLYGEAYFDVSPSTDNDGAPFHVKTKGQTIEVLGTEFNIKAYKNENSIYTTLVEGEVLVNNNTIHENLLPGEQSILDLNQNSLTKVKYEHIENLIAWKDGMFIFKKQSLNEIMITLSRWYNVEFEFNEKHLENILFSGNLKKTEDINSILNYFSKTNEVAFDIKNTTIIIK